MAGRCAQENAGRGKKKRNIALLILLALSAALLSGCGASVTVSAYTENGVAYNEYTVRIDVETMRKMDLTAADDLDGNKYTVRGYLAELFTSYDCELVDSKYASGSYVAVFRKAFDGEEKKSPAPATFVSENRLRNITEQISYTTDLTRDPFVRRYRSVSKDPFNGVRAAYDSVQPGQSATVIQRLKNGFITTYAETGETVVLLPPVQDAFPYVKGMDVGGLELRYASVGSKRMNSSGKAAEIDDRNARYVFSRYFDKSERTIVFEYSRPEVYGWYIVALAAGGVTVAIFVFVTRTRKQKPTLLDRFPYNPEVFRDYENHLPMNR